MCDESAEQLSSDVDCDNSNSPSDQHKALSPIRSPISPTLEDEVKEGKIKKDLNIKYQTTSQFIPAVAVPERIVVCIDRSVDKSLGYSCRSLNQDTIEPTIVLIETLRVFITNKLAIAKDTNFAFVSVEPGKIELLSNFTCDTKHLMKSLEEIKKTPIVPEEGVTVYDVTTMISFVLNLVDIPDHPKPEVTPPDYVLRMIFVYNNANIIPSINKADKHYVAFSKSPYCVLDILYLHEAQSDFNNVEEIFKELSKMILPRSYLFECSRNVTLIFNTFAKLLAHPYQRVNQEL